MSLEAVQTIDVPIQVALPFVVEIAETEDLKPYIYDIYLNGEDCLTDSMMPFISKELESSLFYLYERARDEQEKAFNSNLDPA